MGYTQVALEDKLLEMYPEILSNGINISVTFDDSRNSWVVRFDKCGHSRYAFLDKQDADACMDGLQCIYLGTLITQYIVDLEKEIGLVE